MSRFGRARRRTFRHLSRAALGTLVSLLLIPTVWVVSAEAHGSTIDPPSRNYGCWSRWGSDFQNPVMATQDPMCWQAWQADSTAMWNWNGLYIDGVNGNYQGAVPDGQLCSAGNTGGTRYAALDNPGAWTAKQVSNQFTLKIHDQALHGADFHQVYVTKQGYNALTTALRWSDLELVTTTGKVLPGAGSKETAPSLSGVSVSLDVNAPNRTGRHVVYALWKASHSDQTYYFCSDVIFPGGTTDPTTTTTTTRPVTSTTTTTTTTRPVTTTSTTTRPVTTTTLPTTTTRPVTTTTLPTTTTRPVTTTTLPTTTTRPVTTTTGVTTGATTGTSSRCTAAVTVTGSWPGGWQGSITVTNPDASSLTGWTVTWQQPSGATVTQGWGGAITQSGTLATLAPASWNTTIAGGQSTTAGFLASGTPSPAPSSVTCS